MRHEKKKKNGRFHHALTALGAMALLALAFAQPPQVAAQADGESACITCHARQNAALVQQWRDSRHASEDVTCIDCHTAREGEVDAWQHHGEWISTLVTPKDCGGCHDQEATEFSTSHHAKAGEILASLDNVLAEKVAGLPHNKADAINGCWQCHGTIVKFETDDKGAIKRGAEGKPLIDADTWPNSGMGRLNPDGSKGSCNACHSRHTFDAGLARSPENCGKCHMGPDHPQIEIYNESKHGIAFYANRDKMALDKEGDWVLGEDYSAAPTCATCHISPYKTPDGVVHSGTHDVGERISWTLRPIVSSKLNMVVYQDGFKEDYPHTRQLPKVGDKVMTTQKVVKDYQLVSEQVERTVAEIVPWESRRDNMKGACNNCHSSTFVNNFYDQFDGLVDLYNEKFAIPAKQFMDDLKTDGAINPAAPFEHDVQWVFWELWHHEGR
ncbi:MAG TPA: multiheme c-type cytochrome, partial [candidate division Zixibacteria bacterium]|nr:multiheme c-type cytochrome [candidate division Zixibacteria bacterium]